jgi:hypothetical protein
VSPPPAPVPDAEQAADATATTTLTGCVYRERDIPGREPNIAERAGILEDYILADATTSGTQPTATGTSGIVGAATGPMHKMFKLENIDDERLQALVGKRVEVTGRIDAEAADTAAQPAGTTGTVPKADESLGPDTIELPEFEVTAIREVAGTCPATPADRK